MKYSKEFIKGTLESFKDFKVDDRLAPNEKANDSFFVEFGNIKFLVVIPSMEDQSNSKKALTAPLGAFPGSS